MMAPIGTRWTSATAMPVDEFERMDVDVTTEIIIGSPRSEVAEYT